VKKFFIICKFSTAEKLYIPLRDKLLSYGWKNSRDWYELANKQKSNNLEQLQHTATKDAQAIGQSNVIIAIAPGGKDWHIEFGMALCNNKRKGPVILLTNDNNIKTETQYYNHPHVAIYKYNEENYMQSLKSMFTAQFSTC
jgi:hypothetical protein